MAIAFSQAGSAQGKGVTTLSATVTINAGDTSVISISIHANTSPSSVVDSGGSSYKFRQAVNNGTTDRIELWSTDAGAAKASTSVTVQFAASTAYVISVATYTGVLGLGSFTDVGVNNNTGASTAPSSGSIITKDPNNWVVMAVSAVGIGTFSATVPNVIRASAVTAGGSAATNQGGAIADAGAFATIGTNSVTGTISTSETWATASIELRGVSLAYSYLCGFEMNSLGELNATGGTAPTIQSATVHGGSFAMRCHPAAAASFAQWRQIQGPASQSSRIFCSLRFYINIAVLPNVQTLIYSGAFGVISQAQGILLNTDGSLTITDGAGVTASSSVKLSLNTWHLISFAVNPTDGSNFISLTVDGVFQAQVVSTSGQTAVYDTAQLGVGVENTSTPTCDVYFDDVLWANDFAVLGAGQQVLLLPTADSARGNWTAGAGGTTNLWQGVDNIPPVGKAAGSETNTTQIRNPTAAGNNDYTATCQSYSAKGIAAGSTINAVASIVADGVEVAATTHGFVFVASNPTQTAPPTQFEFDYGLGNTQGAFPSLWNVDEGPVSTNPTPTLGTAPTVTVRKVDAVTSADNACFLGIYVDYLTPSATDKSHNVDADVQVTQSKSHNVDADVQIAQSKSHNVDADVKADQSKSHNVDADVKADQSKSHNVDADVQTTSSLSHNVDADVQVAQSKSHNVDADVQVTQSKSHNVDADVQTTSSVSHNVDADVQVSASFSHNVDAVVSLTESASHNVDADVQVSQSLSHFADCFVTVTIPPVPGVFLSLEVQGYRLQLNDQGDGSAIIATTPTQDSTDVLVEFQGYRMRLHPTGNSVIIGGIVNPLYAVSVASV